MFPSMRLPENLRMARSKPRSAGRHGATPRDVQTQLNSANVVAQVVLLCSSNALAPRSSIAQGEATNDPYARPAMPESRVASVRTVPPQQRVRAALARDDAAALR